MRHVCRTVLISFAAVIRMLDVNCSSFAIDPCSQDLKQESRGRPGTTNLYTFDRRYNRTRILTTRAAAAANSTNTAIVYTIPTNPAATGHGNVPVISNRPLFGPRPQPYNTSNDMPPSYEDVTKTNANSTT